MLSAYVKILNLLLGDSQVMGEMIAWQPFDRDKACFLEKELCCVSEFNSPVPEASDSRHSARAGSSGNRHPGPIRIP